MKKCKALVAIILVFALCACLGACGIKQEEAIGTWLGTYEYNGDTFSIGFKLESDGSYRKITYKNGELYKAEDGSWEIEGGKVALRSSSSAGTTYYEYKNEKLVNNDHEFTKS